MRAATNNGTSGGISAPEYLTHQERACVKITSLTIRIFQQSQPNSANYYQRLRHVPSAPQALRRLPNICATLTFGVQQRPRRFLSNRSTFSPLNRIIPSPLYGGKSVRRRQSKRWSSATFSLLTLPSPFDRTVFSRKKQNTISSTLSVGLA